MLKDVLQERTLIIVINIYHKQPNKVLQNNE